ncbi:CPBP family intramembrane metalloprotease [Paenibacillaceae bacterium]|nr:CPBP family intramembrane metalloprotease [Paenibacillaceae bacterium]
MNSLQMDPPWKRMFWLGAIGAVIYLLIQIIPSFSNSDYAGGSSSVIDKQYAEQQAAAFIEEQFDVKPTYVHALHQSDRLLSGYLAKEKLLEYYETTYDQNFPTDTFQVEVHTPRQNSAGSETIYFVYLHMQTGKPVAWNRLGNTLTDEQKQSNYEKSVKAAKAAAVKQGFSVEQLREQLEPSKDGTIILEVIGSKAGEAQLNLHMRTVLDETGQDRIVTFKPAFVVPQGYINYVDQQDKLANSLSVWGYFVLTAVLFILSIIYAVVYRQHSSFKRGLVLTAVFLVFYIINNYNLTDGIRAGFGEDPDAKGFIAIAVAVTILLTIVMAVSVYFALVGGDALWRQMGKSRWPRFNEPGYGEHVWQSMKISYLLAFMLLGIQAIIFVVLQAGIGTWATSDVTQSPYNLKMLWIFPMLAWCAAISEEAVYRLFGIGLLRKWLRNPFIASLIPTMIWALGHVTYPFYPATTRLIELTIMGLILSFAFLRFGFVTAVFTHAILNSIMMSFMLIIVGSPVNVTAAIIYLILPIIIAWVIRIWHKRRGHSAVLTE